MLFVRIAFVVVLLPALLGLWVQAQADSKFPVNTCAPQPATPTSPNGILINFSGYVACSLHPVAGMTMRIHAFYSPFTGNFSDAKDIAESQKWSCTNCQRLPSSGNHTLQISSHGSGYYWTYIYATCPSCVPPESARHSTTPLHMP